ncbi:MAG: hypothetical protein KIH08_17000 [Candidatus Freyarchaeota archaeon]|nr:hypothetical protein [Candidatus Jordarchaeia archaeon]
MRFIRTGWIDTGVDGKVGKFFARAIALWRELCWRYYGLKNVRIDAVDAANLKRLLIDFDYNIEDLRDFWCVYFHEIKFDGWYAQRKIFPSISKSLKFENNFRLRVRFLKNTIDLVMKNSHFLLDVLNIVPTCEIVGGEVLFGLGLEDGLLSQGYSMRDVRLIDHRKGILMGKDGREQEIMFYAHFGYDFDEVSRTLRMRVGKEIVLRVDSVSEVYIRLWNDRKRFMLVGARKDFELLCGG